MSGILILAEMIPALTPAAGKIEIKARLKEQFDMQDEIQENGWPVAERMKKVKEERAKDWWHSDLKDVAYPYVEKLFKKMIELSGLDQD